MKILYGSPFSLRGVSGKNRATRQKIAALRRAVPETRVVSPRKAESTFAKVAALAAAEFEAVWRVLSARRRYDVYISRGALGMISCPVARVRGTLLVREVHANAIEEASMAKGSTLRKLLLCTAASMAYRLDRFADLRIFNNPKLMEWYKDRGAAGANDIFAYNACDPEARSLSLREEARERFGFEEAQKILAFVGSLAEWHGVEQLVELQKEFDEHGDAVRIVCGGGRVPPELDPQGRLLNISPLDERGCADLVRASDACLLPVKDVRVSPGSPLKLYDYILNGGFVIAQAGIPGYADEVERLGVGILVDFEKPGETRIAILDVLQSAHADGCRYDADALIPLISWDSRVSLWLSAIEKASNSRGNRN